MNVEIGTEATQFPEKKYINGIFVAVHDEIAVFGWAKFGTKSWPLHSLIQRSDFYPHQIPDTHPTHQTNPPHYYPLSIKFWSNQQSALRIH
jgi:hypothetical protein